ncbi:hypothetical protein BVRB_7g179700 isoform B [Beta vulgaris subsp. vulgaris]|nr:hypothetical protein BVRB_7g179700 isoform B [Beta vulgaris subsp. vulgaris]
MSDYLDRFEHPLGADLVSYDLFNVKFPWQTSKPTLDCGVFAMVHMLNYDGEICESQLGNAKIRRTMRAEICVISIILGRRLSQRFMSSMRLMLLFETSCG